MARYADLLGRRVQVYYRAGESLMPVTGILAGDSGKSIFLEEHLVEDERVRLYRWEILYRSIVDLCATAAPAAASGPLVAH